MKYKFIALVSLGMITVSKLTAQHFDLKEVRAFEHQLDDVMEVIDTNELKKILKKVEDGYQKDASEINKLRLGIIYHETALNLSFFNKTQYKGYAQKSYDILTDLWSSNQASTGLLPFIASYRASALALVSAETSNLKLLNKAFQLFNEAVEKYSHVSYMPEFLRGSVAENLPWFFFRKRKYAKIDFQSIMDKYHQNKEYANEKIMSFTYWAWANQRQGKKFRKQSLYCLEKAIELDPNYMAARQKSEELKMKLINK